MRSTSQQLLSFFHWARSMPSFPCGFMERKQTRQGHCHNPRVCPPQRASSSWVGWVWSSSWLVQQVPAIITGDDVKKEETPTFSGTSFSMSIILRQLLCCPASHFSFFMFLLYCTWGLLEKLRFPQSVVSLVIAGCAQKPKFVLLLLSLDCFLCECICV